MERYSIILKYGLLLLLFILLLLIVFHWGFMGIVLFGIVYGLWAINTPDE